MKLRSIVREKGGKVYRYKYLSEDCKKRITSIAPFISHQSRIFILPDECRSYKYDSSKEALILFKPPLKLTRKKNPRILNQGGYIYIPPDRHAILRSRIIKAAAFLILVIAGSWAYHCQAEYGAVQVQRLVNSGYHTFEEVPAAYWACDQIPDSEEDQLRCLLCGLRIKRIHDKNLFTLYDRILNQPEYSEDTRKTILARAYHEAEWFGIDPLIDKYSTLDLTRPGL